MGHLLRRIHKELASPLHSTKYADSYVRALTASSLNTAEIPILPSSTFTTSSAFSGVSLIVLHLLGPICNKLVNFFGYRIVFRHCHGWNGSCRSVCLMVLGFQQASWCSGISTDKQLLPDDCVRLQSNCILLVLDSSIFCLYSYHLGTVAFGSLIIAIIRSIRVLLEYIDRKVREYADNCCSRFMLCCCKCCFWQVTL